MPLADARDAIEHLRTADPVIGRLIAKVGPCLWQVHARRSPYESLVRAVAHQQLHAKAAESILGRFGSLVSHGRFPTPEQVLSLHAEDLRGVGFSTAKAVAIFDIARKTQQGVVPSSRLIRALSDEEIIARLTQVRGVGRWTVEMLLMFQLGRPDVLPVDDFGVRNGFRLTYGLAAMPSPKAVFAHGERWRPFRSVASWYLWRAVDLAKANGIPAAPQALVRARRPLKKKPPAR